MLEQEWLYDYRGSAISASQRLVSGRGSRYPLDAQISVCLPTENSRSALKLSSSFVIGAIACGVIFGLTSFGLIYWQAKLPEDQQSEWLSWAAMACIFLAVNCMFIPLKFGGLAIRPFMGDRLRALKSDPNITNVRYVTGIEDAQTFSEIKLTPDDVGYLALDPSNQRIIAEGVLCTYVIHGKDVVGLQSQQEQASPGTRITYRIDENTTLDIVIEQMTLIDETIRQLSGRNKNRGFDRIRATLGFDDELIPIMES